jgi:glycine cleavage system pyridoxal-binding protein P
MLLKAAAVVTTMALVQNPMRLAADVLIWRRVRRLCPQLFDGPACAAAVAACLDEYQRELAPAPARSPGVAP